MKYDFKALGSELKFVTCNDDNSTEPSALLSFNFKFH